ncbi:MAG TPA: hypothetical protein VMT22_24060, partial [Terriglobales bacterium]|nr:hypothetical protein [Terriglobales bacterium]
LITADTRHQYDRNREHFGQAFRIAVFKRGHRDSIYIPYVAVARLCRARVGSFDNGRAAVLKAN